MPRRRWSRCSIPTGRCCEFTLPGASPEADVGAFEPAGGDASHAVESAQVLARLLRPLVQLRDGETATVLLMFLYSFLAMAGYNMIKPVTRGLFIEKLGAENLPWIQFGAGIVIGFIMQGYTRTISMAPRRWMIPLTLGSIVLAMSAFYVLFGSLPNNRTHCGGLLPLRLDHRHPADQPVLDAGQRRVRPATGQARLRLHRRGRQSRRVCRGDLDLGGGPADRDQLGSCW